MNGSRIRATTRSVRIVVVMHVYYTHLLDDLLRRLDGIGEPFDLVVTNASGEVLSLSTPGFARLVEVIEVPNRGRDVLPLIKVIRDRRLDGYELVCKVHTKMSPWRGDHSTLAGDGGQWRDALLDAVLPEGPDSRQVVELLRSQPDIGLVASEDSIVGPEHWGANRRRVRLILASRGWRAIPVLSFAAGSIYWARTEILLDLRRLPVATWLFAPEAGQADGTHAHALERIVGLICLRRGLRVVGLPAAGPGPSAGSGRA